MTLKIRMAGGFIKDFDFNRVEEGSVMAYAKPKGSKGETIIADGHVIREKSELNLWEYVLKVDVYGTDEPRYITVKTQGLLEKSLRQKVNKNKIKNVSWARIERNVEEIKCSEKYNFYFKREAISDEWISRLDRRPKLGHKVEVKCELGKITWVQEGFFTGTVFNNEMSGPKKVVAWRELQHR